MEVLQLGVGLAQASGYAQEACEEIDSTLWVLHIHVFDCYRMAMLSCGKGRVGWRRASFSTAEG